MTINRKPSHQSRRVIPHSPRFKSRSSGLAAPYFSSGALAEANKRQAVAGARRWSSARLRQLGRQCRWLRRAGVNGSPQPGQTASKALEEDIQQHVRGRLAPYEYPKEIEFIDALPMTTTGKVQRKELRKREEAKA